MSCSSIPVGFMFWWASWWEIVSEIEELLYFSSLYWKSTRLELPLDKSSGARNANFAFEVIANWENSILRVDHCVTHREQWWIIGWLHHSLNASRLAAIQQHSVDRCSLGGIQKDRKSRDRDLQKFKNRKGSILWNFIVNARRFSLSTLKFC